MFAAGRRLRALDAGTGRERWALDLPDGVAQVLLLRPAPRAALVAAASDGSLNLLIMTPGPG